MNYIFLKRTINLKTINNSISRSSKRRKENYAHNVQLPKRFPFPHNMWQNVDPGMTMDKVNEPEAEFIAIPGSSAPSAWNGKREFPEDYKPYLINYKRHGFLSVVFFFICLMNYTLNEELCKLQGRKTLVSHREDHKIINSFFFIRKWEKGIIEMAQEGKKFYDEVHLEIYE